MPFTQAPRQNYFLTKASVATILPPALQEQWAEESTRSIFIGGTDGIGADNLADQILEFTYMNDVYETDIYANSQCALIVTWDEVAQPLKPGPRETNDDIVYRSLGVLSHPDVL